MDNTYTNKYYNAYYINQPTAIPTICNNNLTKITYESYAGVTLQNSSTLTIPTSSLPNYMRTENKGYYLILPYFLKYNISQDITSISATSATDNSFTVENSTLVSFNTDLSTYLEIMNGTNILLLVKILNISTISSGVYKIYTEFIPPNIATIISTATSIKIVVCEVLIPFEISPNYVFTSNYIMNKALKLNNNVLFDLKITAMTNCYDSESKEIVCNCAGNSISNSKSVTFIADNDNLLAKNNTDILLFDNGIKKHKTPILIPDIIRNNKYLLTKEIIYDNDKVNKNTTILNDITLADRSKLETSLSSARLVFPNIYNMIKIKVNSYECNFSENNYIITIHSPSLGNLQFLKYNNLVEIYTDPDEIIEIIEPIFFKNLDFIIRVPVCTSDFSSLEELDSAESISHDKKIESKYTTSHLNNNLKQVLNSSSSLSITEYEKIVDNYFYFSLDKDIVYNLISYTSQTGVVRIFKNCMITSTSLTEDVDVNKKQFSINYEKELKYNIIEFTELEEL